MSGSKREQACAAAPFSTPISAELHGYAWARDNVGESGAAVYRLHDKSRSPTCF
jgi:aminoglycoside 3'-phosphotransferase-1